MKTIPTTKQMYKLRKVRLRANSLDACLIQLSGSHGISSATARTRVVANMSVAATNVTNKPVVLEQAETHISIGFLMLILLNRKRIHLLWHYN